MSCCRGHRFRDETLVLPSIKAPAPKIQSPELPITRAALNVPSPLSPGLEYTTKHGVDVKVDIVQISKSRKATSNTPVPITHTPPRSPNVSPNLEDHNTLPSTIPNGVGHATLTRNQQQSLTNSTRPQTGDQLSNASERKTTSPRKPASSTKVAATAEKDIQSDVSRKEEQDDSITEAVHHTNEAASSPSSTAGAYSTSTPKPAPPSPDTSPEAAPSPVQHPELVQETVLAISARENKGVKEVSFDDVTIDSTPEQQLRLEEAQAKEAASRSSVQTINTEINDEPNGAESSGLRLENVLQSAQASPALTEKIPSSLKTSAHESSHDDVEMLNATPKKADDISFSSNDVRQKTILPPITPTTPSRMTTRVASGAIRQKSVSEILGETPKITSQLLQSPADIQDQGSSPKSEEHRLQRRKSTVVFSKDKDLTSQAHRSELDGYLALKGASLDPEKDYLRPLFLMQAYQSPRAKSLTELITHPLKTITTSDITSNIREQVDSRILRRIYQLQNANKWSLRQPIRYPDPAPVRCHLDYLVEEMKWMRTDFKEERKWKMAIARHLAITCAAYVNGSDEQKASLCVKSTSSSTERVIADSFDEPPELISGGTSEASEDDIPLALAVQTPPHALFSLGFDDVVFKIDDTPSANALISELPLYDPKSESQPNDTAIPLPPKDNILPVSKFVTGKIVPKIVGAPRKRSRYDFELSEEEYGPSHKRARSNSSAPLPFLSPARRSSPRTELPPEDQEVALFNPVNKHILARIRANNSFRPPHEFPMPNQPFYENRVQSKWTWDEDQRLRHCVRHYHYNWSLIAQDLQFRCQPSQFVSGADRRTPWECFERWTQLEGLPTDLGRSNYFKAYSQRIEAAVKTVSDKQAIASQNLNLGARAKGLPPDKISQRRDTRHVNMIDAMRRSAKRRENQLYRQQECS
jgi:chromatin modification-related protein VID21